MFASIYPAAQNCTLTLANILLFKGMSFGKQYETLLNLDG
jgi:hypothetical protein